MYISLYPSLPPSLPPPSLSLPLKVSSPPFIVPSWFLIIQYPRLPQEVVS
uniref:Uncharacterized protein n=1 Tax=Amphimedon queenslandica TaxID=400682 RepID=A0A1X7SNA0_AMPQE